jgi:hypothetical protein
LFFALGWPASWRMIGMRPTVRAAEQGEPRPAGAQGMNTGEASSPSLPTRGGLGTLAPPLDPAEQRQTTACRHIPSRRLGLDLFASKHEA